MWNELATRNNYEAPSGMESRNLLKDFARTNSLSRLQRIIPLPEQAAPEPQ
jgi:hypothetical protein